LTPLADWHSAHATLAHPLVRALAWCIGSPSAFNPALPCWNGALLDDAAGLAALQEAWPHLLALDREPAPLERWMDWRPHAPMNVKRPLGKTFEMLIGYWLAHRRDVAWVQPSVLAKESGRVVGEFDHVWADRAGALHTIELTVKFYLRIAPARGARGYVGPMVYDYMAEKIERMATHQMPLSGTAAGQRAMRALAARMKLSLVEDAPISVTAHALSRGILFSQWGAPAVPEPVEVGPQVQRGHWISSENVQNVPTPQLREWSALDGVQWLGPQRVLVSQLQTLTECAALIGKERHAMVGRFRVNAELGTADEIERWIIVRPDARVFDLLSVQDNP
jgi:hypothetical protein